jgi:GMP synthase-like glutamine amidotransferase
MRRPFLGVCLGHQLLAEAIGGTVGHARPEFGVLTVDKTAQRNQDRMLQNIAHPMLALQWHAAEVLELPSGTAVLASSPACAIQSFRYGRRAYGLQFHYRVVLAGVSVLALEVRRLKHFLVEVASVVLAGRCGGPGGFGMPAIDISDHENWFNDPEPHLH